MIMSCFPILTQGSICLESEQFDAWATRIAPAIKWSDNRMVVVAMQYPFYCAR
ncbi:MAG: hypothetical protein UW09_C0004G0017 [candidate division TM6 bacterium GW2011_GWF2_43_87]|nr:MAG: hypothetical protein UW09_C0004G0017 [candidate division TM6 bacterium GW2011_GWF2_43_87]